VADTPEEDLTTGLLDRVKGKTKQVIGNITNNEQLEREGELHEQRADAAQEARRLAAQADAAQEETDLIAREQELAVEEDRLAAEETAAAREERLEREQQATEQNLAREQAQREAEVRSRERATEVVVSHDEDAALRERAQAQQVPNALETEAQRARDAADALKEAADRQADERG
jgi:uncharacterized protein YjbJ (UPF0337 family)